MPRTKRVGADGEFDESEEEYIISTEIVKQHYLYFTPITPFGAWQSLFELLYITKRAELALLHQRVVALYNARARAWAHGHTRLQARHVQPHRLRRHACARSLRRCATHRASTEHDTVATRRPQPVHD